MYHASTSLQALLLQLQKEQKNQDQALGIYLLSPTISSMPVHHVHTSATYR